MSKLLTDEGIGPFISGGYRLVKYVERPEYKAKDLLPDRILTTSSCITDTLPDSWAVAWIKEERSEREKSASKFTIDRQKLGAVTDWVTSQIDEGKVGIPNVFYSTNAARDFLTRFNLPSKDLVLLGIGIHKRMAEDFIESTRVQNVMDGLVSAVEQKLELESMGKFLGYDIYGHETGSYHSWLCNSLEKVAYDKFGVRSNKYGLIDNYEDAVKCAEHFEQPEVGAEQVPWFPWKLIQYKL